MKEEELGKLISKIDKLFSKKKQKYDQISFVLARTKDGYWQIKVYDDWHRWSRAGIKELPYKYNTPELACKEFLKFIEENDINIKSLQEKN